MQVDTLELSQKFNLYGCIQCGKCAGGCPVSMKTALDVRFLIYEALVGVLPDPAHMEELWDCTCCFTCVERCPKDVKPAELIIGLRGLLVESTVDSELLVAIPLELRQPLVTRLRTR